MKPSLGSGKLAESWLCSILSRFIGQEPNDLVMFIMRHPGRVVSSFEVMSFNPCQAQLNFPYKLEMALYGYVALKLGGMRNFPWLVFEADQHGLIAIFMLIRRCASKSIPLR